MLVVEVLVDHQIEMQLENLAQIQYLVTSQHTAVVEELHGHHQQVTNLVVQVEVAHTAQVPEVVLPKQTLVQ
tara:strand:- start:356 stop:571 length:216 start_codon:yes stop_codon:yes gene_type:complete